MKELKAIEDPRFAGAFDGATDVPEGLRNRGAAMGRAGYDMWANDKSMFSPDFSWALVRRQEKRLGIEMETRGPCCGEV